MASYTIERHVQMIKLYYQNECSIVQTLRPFYGRRGDLSKSTHQRLVAKFETTGSVNIQPTPVRLGTPDRPRTLPRSVKVCRRTRGSQFLAVLKHSAFRRLQLGEFCVGTWAYTHTRSNWSRSSKLMTIDKAACSLTGLRNIWRGPKFWPKNHL